MALLLIKYSITKQQIGNKRFFIWGQSSGGAFAAMHAKEKESKINRLMFEVTLNLFLGMGQFYGSVINLEKFKRLITLLMHIDYRVGKQS